MQRTTRLKKPQVPKPGELINFDDITNRPKYAGEPMTHETNIPSVEDETTARQAADRELWTEIETIEAASDVVDVVGTYAELEAYDTSKLHDKDLIKVLADETRDDAITYYRWSTSSSSFSYVGAEGPYYTASETDTLLSAKQDNLVAGTNIQIASDGKTISATDTTYNTFTSTVDGLVPAPGSSNYRKYLLDDAGWVPQIVEYAPSIDSTDGTLLVVAEKMSNGMNYTARTYDLRMTGATSSANGKTGFVPIPRIADKDKFLKGNGTWADVAANTIFYMNSSESGATRHIFKNSAMTDMATSQEVFDANEKGQVILRISTSVTPDQYSDAYLQNAYKATGDYQLLFLDEKTYRSFDTTTLSANTFTYSARVLQDQLTAGTNIQINGATISATDTTYNNFGGATSSTDGSRGLVPAPLVADKDKFLKGDGTWATVQGGSSMTVFYMDNYPGYTTAIYTDSACTTAAQASDLNTALAAGEVRVCQMVGGVAAYYYDISGYNSASGYYSVGQYSDSTTVYTFDFDTATTIEWTKSESQSKLTAGTGITISSSNVISASGAVTNNINSTDWNALWQ